VSVSEAQAGFPGTLYDGDGTVLAGSGPAFTPALTDDLPYKALVRAEPGAEAVAVLEAGDRFWLLPEGFGAPSELPMALPATANSLRGLASAPDEAEAEQADTEQGEARGLGHGNAT
jgi:hypothetical protein